MSLRGKKLEILIADNETIYTSLPPLNTLKKRLSELDRLHKEASDKDCQCSEHVGIRYTIRNYDQLKELVREGSANHYNFLDTEPIFTGAPRRVRTTNSPKKYN